MDEKVSPNQLQTLSSSYLLLHIEDAADIPSAPADNTNTPDPRVDKQPSIINLISTLLFLSNLFRMAKSRRIYE